MSALTPEAVAAGLTKAQRDILTGETWAGWKIFTYWSETRHHAMQRLQIDGLFDHGDHWNTRWNDLGRAVRIYLLRQDEDAAALLQAAPQP